MELKTFFAQDLSGNVIPSPTVNVYQPGTTTRVTGLQTATGAALSNPFFGSGTGQITLAAPDGTYDLAIAGGGRAITMRVRFVDVTADGVALAQAAAVESAASAAAVEAAQVAAEAARDSSFANAKGDTTIADARALVADTETFIVYAENALTFSAYRRTSSTTQDFLGEFPSANYVIGAIESYRDGYAGYILPFTAIQDGVRVVFAGIKEAAGIPYFRVPGAEFDIDSTIGAGRDGPATTFRPLLKVGGKPYIAINDAGELDFKPSSSLLSRISGDGYLRGTWGSNVFNVRGVEAGVVATVQDRSGRVFDALQRTGGINDTLVMRSSAPIEILLRIGQSNAGQGGQGGVLLSKALYPYSVMGVSGYSNSQAYGTVAISAASATDLYGMSDQAGAAPVRGQYPSTMMGFALSDLNAQQGTVDPGYIAITAWEGSQPLDSFFPATADHYNYENAIELLTAATAKAALFGRDVVVRVIQFTQGEAGSGSRAAYATKLDDLLTAILPGIKAATGQPNDPLVMLSQTSVTQGASENYSCMGQFDVANSRADTYLAAPMYPYPLYDTIHLSPTGRMMQGDVEADVYRRIVTGVDWKPIQIASAVRSGVYIDVMFEGTLFDEGYSLQQSGADLLPAVANLGFSTYSGATVTGAAITGANTVRLTCAATVPAGAVLQYATAVNSAEPGWSYRLGNLCIKTRARSAYYPMGFAVPEYITHFACRYEAALS